VVWWRNSRASDFRPKGQGFDSRLGRSCITTLGKLFTPTCLDADSLHYYMVSLKPGTFTLPLFRTTQVSQYQKGKTNLNLLEQETLSGSDISWAMCKSAPQPRQTTTPTLHQVFYKPDALPATQPIASKYWRFYSYIKTKCYCNYLRRRRRLCFWFGLFVCLSVRRITRKLVNGFWQNFLEG